VVPKIEHRDHGLNAVIETLPETGTQDDVGAAMVLLVSVSH
tara:strand:+ start:1472 stop:1594 length:123 start_codon:yes stop_codon:yes gene_type:complete